MNWWQGEAKQDLLSCLRWCWRKDLVATQTLFSQIPLLILDKMAGGGGWGNERQRTENYNLRISCQLDQNYQSRDQPWTNKPKACGQEALLWSMKDALTGPPPCNLSCLCKIREKVESHAGSTSKTHTPPGNPRKDLSNQVWISTGNTWTEAASCPITVSLPTVQSKLYPVNNKRAKEEPFTLLDRYRLLTVLPSFKDKWYTENYKCGNYVEVQEIRF